MESNKSLCMIDAENRDYIILVQCIDSADETILLILSISKVNILYKWCQHNDLYDNIVIGITETHYANNDISLE